ncbi:MAG: hypothetical protein J6Y69_06165 [Treponema sp.]|nr:hypothetical protein [Treponema sp.]
MKKSVLLIAIMLFIAGIAGAQSAERVTEILQEKQVTYGEIAYLAASELNLIQANASYDDAIKAAVNEGILKGNPASTDPINYKDLAYACCKTWNISGSLFYKMTKSPRYAFKQLQAIGIIPANADPSQKVSGRNALNIISACIESFESEGDAE